MGLPLGPTFANIFMCYHEQKWLLDCPPEFKPALYRRYIDDTFLLFNEKSHVDSFLLYLNSKHNNIKFTCETENNNSINFLDININRSLTFTTSVFRKPTFSVLIKPGSNMRREVSRFSYLAFQWEWSILFLQYEVEKGKTEEKVDGCYNQV
ncbi:hypothetical protein GQR58_024281 [Nymphon striatum]|nr:hypothetical protein GQR58_024281 [Nymphon striatum]